MIDTFCLYNLLDLLKFLNKCFDFRLELVDDFTEIVPSTYKSILSKTYNKHDITSKSHN